MATPIKDSNGATINLNDSVKLVGTVLSINTLNDRYAEVVVQLKNPVTGGITTVTGPANSFVVGS